MSVPYNKLTESDKNNIISIYYNPNYKNFTFKQMANLCGVSERAFSRVLTEKGINTKLKNRYKIENEKYFDEINTENKAYFLGLLFADGYVGNENQIIIELRDVGNTKKILDTFVSELKSNIDIKINNHKKTGGFSTNSTFLKISFSNKYINEALKKLGLGSHKGLSRFNIPKEVIDNKLQAHFIRGLFDGDGSSYIKNKNRKTPQKCITFMGNDSLLLEIREILVNELNVNRNNIRKSTNSDKISELRFGGNKQVEKISNYLYNNSHIYLDFKKF